MCVSIGAASPYEGVFGGKFWQCVDGGIFKHVANVTLPYEMDAVYAIFLKLCEESGLVRGMGFKYF